MSMKQDDPIHYEQLVNVAQRIRERQVSPIELTQHMLDRIQRLDPKLHAYARTMPEQALSQARLATEQLMKAGAVLGPLHGVPVAVKDNCFTQGVVTANGQAIHANFKPAYDSTVVRKLKDAGAILIGKLQHTEGAFAEHHATVPVPVNPWSDHLWPGASSSGSGVGTAAGLCFASLGTDTGGSIRMPCAANGLTGVKPTWGRVSRYGVYENSASLDHVGPMTRSAADAAVMLGVLAGEDPNDATAAALPVPDYLGLAASGIKGLRIGLDAEYTTRDVDAPTVAAMKQAVATLAGLGATIVDVKVPDTRPTAENWMQFSGVEMAVAHEATYPSQKESYGGALSGLIELGYSTTAMQMQKILMYRLQFRSALEKLFNTVDLIAIPVQCNAALTNEKMGRLGEDPNDVVKLVRFTAPYDMSGHPTITLPCGLTPDGYPVTFQLVAPLMKEEIFFNAAIAFQQATSWHLKHPAL